MYELKETGRDDNENPEEICEALLLSLSYSLLQNINILVRQHACYNRKPAELGLFSDKVWKIV
jgi:hypothetical protein